MLQPNRWSYRLHPESLESIPEVRDYFGTKQLLAWINLWVIIIQMFVPDVSEQGLLSCWKQFWHCSEEDLLTRGHHSRSSLTEFQHWTPFLMQPNLIWGLDSVSPRTFHSTQSINQEGQHTILKPGSWYYMSTTYTKSLELNIPSIMFCCLWFLHISSKES